MKRPSTPTATAARASVAMKRRSPDRLVAAGAGQLHRVGRVEDDRRAEFAHDLERAEVADEVAVAEGRAALGEQ